MKLYQFSTQDLREWHKWFAWHPVVTDDNQWVWLETVERGVKFYAHDNVFYYRRLECTKSST